MKKNEALTLELEELKLSYSRTVVAHEALMKDHESLSLSFIKKKQDLESLTIVHEELRAEHTSLQTMQLPTASEAPPAPCEKCIASTNLIASNASVASITILKHAPAPITSAIIDANPPSKEIAYIMSENARLQKLLELGMLKCRKGSEILCELLSKQRMAATKDGLGFTPNYTSDGEEWEPHQYLKDRRQSTRGG